MEKALDAISKGGVIALVGGVVGRGLGFLNRAVIAKFFGPEGLGLFVLGLMWVTIIRTLSTGGFVPALKKFVPLHLTNDDGKKLRDTVLTIFTISLLISITGGILLFTFSRFIAVQIFNSENLAPILKVMAFVIPLRTLFRLVLHLYLAFEKPKYKVLFEVGMYALFLPIIIFIVFFQWGVFGLSLGHLVRILLILVISLVIFEKKVYPIFKKKIKADRKIDLKIKSILDYSLPLVFSAALIMIMGKADTFMLGYFKTEELVGIYNLVLPIASLLTIFLASMNQVFFPVISSL
ncbi:MAG: oligosaccharide flippase family protein, partial [Candidatus Aenigmatarchaeota archaeon]